MALSTRVALAILTAAVFAVLAGCGDTPHGYEARIRRTSYGIPHIEASDWGGLGFGEGYAQAEDHLCSIADQVVRVRGERARYFGRGESDRHLNSDITMRALAVRARAEAELASMPERFREWLRGFVAGYNSYLMETGVQDIPGWCRGEDWVQSITAEDLFAYQRMFIMTGSYLVDAIATAAPPDDNGVAQAVAYKPQPFNEPGLGSNGWGIGRDLSEAGQGMLLANPHYPWVGSNRFWEKHLAIPGELDVYGAHLVGIPGVAIGFNRGVAWTHTVSAGERTTLYELELSAGSSLKYRYGLEERELTPRLVKVQVLSEEGSTETVERNVYFSHYGPVLNFPDVGWSEERVLALRDANLDNEYSGLQWLEMNLAGSLDELIEAHARRQALPFVNTVAAGSDGRAWYADTASTPHLSPEAIKLWLARRAEGLTERLWRGAGIVLLDGGDSRFEWVDDAEARDPGVVPYRLMPQLERVDYVFNANDSFWLANSRQPIEGPYSPLHGEQRTARSLRTRNNDLTLSNRSPDRPAGEDGKLSLDEMLAAALSNRSLAAELFKPAVVAACRDRQRVEVDGRPIDLAEACETLDAWDGRFDIESRGAVLFREMMARYDRGDLVDRGKLFDGGFGADDPVGTPAVHDLDAEAARSNLAEAILLLQSRGIALDVPLGELQYADKAGKRIPIHGGTSTSEGLLNVVVNAGNATTLEPLARPRRIKGSRLLTEEGYPIGTGTSYLLGVEYRPEGPRAKAILTYSQSGDPASDHFADQTELFSRKQLRPVLFEESDIASDVQREYVVRGDR